RAGRGDGHAGTVAAPIAGAWVDRPPSWVMRSGVKHLASHRQRVSCAESLRTQFRATTEGSSRAERRLSVKGRVRSRHERDPSHARDDMVHPYRTTPDDTASWTRCRAWPAGLPGVTTERPDCQ